MSAGCHWSGSVGTASSTVFGTDTTKGSSSRRAYTLVPSSLPKSTVARVCSPALLSAVLPLANETNFTCVAGLSNPYLARSDALSATKSTAFASVIVLMSVSAVAPLAGWSLTVQFLSLRIAVNVLPSGPVTWMRSTVSAFTRASWRLRTSLGLSVRNASTLLGTV